MSWFELLWAWIEHNMALRISHILRNVRQSPELPDVWLAYLSLARSANS